MGRSGYETTNIWSAEDPETPYSICSAETPEIEEDHPLFPLKDLFLQVVMSAYQARGRQRDESVQAFDNIEPSIEPIDNDHDEDERPRKRGRFLDSTSSTTSEKQTQRTLNKRRAQDRRLWLACPYAKKDPVQYRDCYRYFLGRIRDVKQHLTRCHRKPIYCPICNELFSGEEERDSHIRQSTCKPRPSIIIEGVSEKQKKELSQRVSSKMPEEQQWFTVFDTLFSPHPRPRTPYRDKELSDDLCVFHDFMTARGPTLLAEFLEARGVTTANLPHEEGDLSTFKKEVLAEALQRIIDQWASDSATIGRVSAPHSLRSSPTIDSGIAMQSGYSQTSEEQKPDNAPRAGLPPLITGNKRSEENENRYTVAFIDRGGNPRKEEGTVQAEDGSGDSFQSMMDASATSSRDITMNSNQDHALGASDALTMSQFAALSEYGESSIFNALTEASDSFDHLKWPP
ncbi:uncharacterized protein F4822DRAFT_432456 [Hypoxylon trugodes]|uniref:uncharacterized protein n=1 Tax=Hypoxylon trugodes TaxID=326681 RepID=UPI002193B925|nr:uncharacterized protein F4822DRAFT_432456 [Hypoxylon trugodes]KAI1385601.1 hypothetical protein F4822DRAFT_432456 [Hypoxylon trugodes]